LQSYSSFTTSYKPAQEYESLLIAASKQRAKALKQLERREALEVALVRRLVLCVREYKSHSCNQKQANFSLETYTQYIAFERRARQPDLSMMSGVYERAIAEAARRRFNEESGAEEALRSFWTGYIDALVSPAD
jgi:squamous cell carcinoma antigen recognized by T-cells 3